MTRAAVPGGSLMAGIVVWEIAARLWPAPFFPPLTAVLASGRQMIESGELSVALSASLIGLAAGYGAAVLFGVTLGVLMARSRTIEYLLDVPLDAFLAAPSLIYVPVLFALFGVSGLSQGAVVFVYAFFIIVETSCAAVRTIDPTLVEMARSFGATGRQLFWSVTLPGARPLIGAGLRIGVGRAVKGMVNGEMFIALSGLGALVRTHGSRFDAEPVLAILLVIMAVALACTWLLSLAERRVLQAPEA